LSEDELLAWRARDIAVGRSIRSPIAGVVQGIAAHGALLVRSAETGHIESARSGSLLFADAATP
jgi:biotin-(acetyl-CoA carboxylase) ligase